jgi:hypothetical protein
MPISHADAFARCVRNERILALFQAQTDLVLMAAGAIAAPEYAGLMLAVKHIQSLIEQEKTNAQSETPSQAR